MAMKLPRDPMLLLSVVNTKLRDFYKDLDSLCEDMEVDKSTIILTLAKIEHEYDEESNQFV